MGQQATVAPFGQRHLGQAPREMMRRCLRSSIGRRARSLLRRGSSTCAPLARSVGAGPQGLKQRSEGVLPRKGSWVTSPKLPIRSSPFVLVINFRFRSNREEPVRATVFRFALELGHCPKRSACRKRANRLHPDMKEADTDAALHACNNKRDGDDQCGEPDNRNDKPERFARHKG
jgi:hypothetical protein